MKKTIWILITALGASNLATAQSKWGEDSVACHEKLYIYYELAKSKNYLEAYEPWKYVYENCPASSINNFIYGPYIVEAKIKAAGTEAEKEPFRKLLMEVYDNRLVHFPEKHDYVYGRKALDMMQYYPDSSKAAYELFKKALEIGGPEQSAAFYNGYFMSAARLFNDKVFTLADVFQAYNVVTEGIEVNTDALNIEVNKLTAKDTSGTITDKEKATLERGQRELDRYNDLVTNIEKILAPIATCDRLKEIYNEEAFQAHKTDPVWLRRAARMLSNERTNDEGETVDCTDDPIFFKVAEALYNIEPSATAARAVGAMAAKNGNSSKAIEYYKEAANLEVDPKKQATDWVRIGSAYIKLGNYAAAKSAALKASSYRSNWGLPYIILAQSYAGADGQCGSNVFEKKAVYWAAIDKLKQAKSVDPSISSQANKLIASYKAQLPDKGISFQLGHTQGEQYTIGCFINETITADWTL